MFSGDGHSIARKLELPLIEWSCDKRALLHEEHISLVRITDLGVWHIKLIKQVPDPE
jgi:hypothetical protein